MSNASQHVLQSDVAITPTTAEGAKAFLIAFRSTTDTFSWRLAAGMEEHSR